MDYLTKAFWKRLLENNIHAFSGGMLGFITAEKVGLITQVPWTEALQVGAMGVVITTLISFSSQVLPNTPPASFIPPKDSEQV